MNQKCVIAQIDTGHRCRRHRYSNCFCFKRTRNSQRFVASKSAGIAAGQFAPGFHAD